MAFRKLSFRRKTFRRRGAPLARVRRTWFQSFRTDWCNTIQLPLNGCEPESGDAENDLRLVLMDQASMQGIFSDRVRVRRIVGDIWWLGEFLTPLQDLPAAIAANSAINTFQAFYGLRKDQVTAGQPFGMTFEPMLNDFDSTEGQWLKTWQYATLGNLDSFAGAANITGVNFPVAESRVSTGIAPCIGQNNFVTGTGTFCIETSTDVNCYNCENTAVPTTQVGGMSPKLNHFHIDHRRSIPMRENEQLMLQMGFVFPRLQTLEVNEPTFHFFGNIKTLLEY